MAKENKFLNDLRDQNLIDDRGLCTVADITCTNGNRWRGYVMIHNTTMRLFSMTFPANVGELIDVIELDNADLMKTFGIIPFTLIKFYYQGHTYRIEHFSPPQIFIQAMKEACRK